MDPRRAQVVELRYVGGLTVEETPRTEHLATERDARLEARARLVDRELSRSVTKRRPLDARTKAVRTISRRRGGTLSIKPSDRLLWSGDVERSHPQLKAAGFIEKRTGKGSHVLFVHPESGKEIWVTMHGHGAGRLGSRILRDAGVE
jgi:predicted RNA binding protein YcfA (HicA-like mRNA interferase family)